MTKTTKFSGLLLSALVLSSCANVERVVLLPNADGKKSAVVVRSEGQEVELTQPYTGVEISGKTAQQKTYSESELKQRYADIFSIQPARAQSFILTFKDAGTELTDDSQARLAQVKEALSHLPAAEIIVIGHTDRVGSVEANDALSLRRAEAIKNLLVTQGYAAESIETVGRGERQPLIASEDEVAEPGNRRVEIKIR
jgi:outer membrane protein OmpA-like peptidoglycan-associated protein